ncbi:DNA-binding transcriptional LysR family regulator [Jatrophihabitans sp. GAS493]|uniref:LysR family transcriptional regulator n=1 Tax=Jatrophihabitans sp. GAS493 TaxID=1907575 RepID=UPI000BBF42EA|nr:LysR family transcriptional regulator [Jatrophihabitans sp. GAS493]SOD74522.1 DNA-binding transcriptional LysR family regulator [Jatrophihabitans sp. GAS493]
MLSPHVPDLAALEVFLAVARTGSLNAASAEVGVSQQAISARITSIESQIGIVLLSRTPRGSTLTPMGVVVAEWASRLLVAAAELDAGLASLRQDRRARLRVSASLTVAEQLLPAWLVALRAGNEQRGEPLTQIELTATNSDAVAAMVRDAAAELGFVEGPQAPKGLRSRAVGHDRLVVVVPPDHPWSRRQRPLTAAELARSPLVTREIGSGTRDALDAALRRALGADPELAAPALALSTAAAVRSAVIAGAGPAVLSELTVADDLSTGRLRGIQVEGLELSRTLRAVWLGGATPPSGAARDLVAIAVAHPAGRP